MKVLKKGECAICMAFAILFIIAVQISQTYAGCNSVPFWEDQTMDRMLQNRFIIPKNYEQQHDYDENHKRKKAKSYYYV